MITRVGMAPRRRDLSPGEALAHWRTTHADAAARIPGLRRYVQLHPVLVDDGFPLAYPGFDAGSMLDFDDLAAMEAGFASAAYRRDVRADEASFIDPAGFSLVITERRVHAPIVEPMVLVTHWRSHPAVDRERLWAALDQILAPTVASEGRGHEHLRPVGHDAGGRHVDASDGIDLVGFPDLDEALDWVRRGTGARLDRDLAPWVFGTARLVARPHRVV